MYITTQASSQLYRADIDGLRAIAVLAVIVCHVHKQLLPSGYLGVDMFFVISGFVITASLMRDSHTSFGSFILSFYQRRIKRLAPALAFFLIVTALVIALIDELAGMPLRTGAFAILGISNIQLALEATNYFGRSASLNAFVHTWSLGVEEQFYFLFPFLFWLLYARRNDSDALFWTVFLISAVSLVAFVTLYRSHQAYVYFMMPTRFWELGAGILTYLTYSKASRIASLARRIPPAVPVVLLLGVFFSPSKLAIINTMAVVVLTCVTLLSLRKDTLAYSALTLKPAIWTGLISYSLYLWHWGVLVIARLTIGVTPVSIVFLVALMFALAWLSYTVIEKPLRHAKWASSAGRTISIGLAGIAVCFVSVFALSSNHLKLNLANRLGYETSHFQITWWKDQRTGTYLERCHPKGRYTRALLDQCLPAQEDGARLFLIGDSHARNYLPTMQGAFPEYTVSYFTMGYGCAYLPGDLAQRYGRDLATWCTNYVDDVTERLTTLVEPGDIVAIGQRLWRNPERQGSSYLNFISARSEMFLSEGARVILLDGTYPPDTHPQFCLNLPWRPMRDGCAVTLEETQDAFAEFDSRASAMARAREGLYYAPLRAGLCVQGQCGQLSRMGHPVWHDRGHITEAAALELVPHLRRQLANQGF